MIPSAPTQFVGRILYHSVPNAPPFFYWRLRLVRCHLPQHAAWFAPTTLHTYQAAHLYLPLHSRACWRRLTHTDPPHPGLPALQPLCTVTLPFVYCHPMALGFCPFPTAPTWQLAGCWDQADGHTPQPHPTHAPPPHPTPPHQAHTLFLSGRHCPTHPPPPHPPQNMAMQRTATTPFVAVAHT